MKILLTLNPENASTEEIQTYPVREAVRTVLVDDKGNVGVIHAGKDEYYKIPGGGIEMGEDKYKALKRECLEEIGCEIEVLGEVGKIIEYRKMFNLTQVSYCYLAKVKGTKGSPHYEKDEIEEEFEPGWVSYADALKLFSGNPGKTPEEYYYMVPRDLHFLRSANNLTKVEKFDLKVS
jgi:8-oxo-dGTP pyrophosphatase MutT (NUDIX family)